MMGNTDCWFYPEHMECAKRDTSICGKWCDKFLLYGALVKQARMPERFQRSFMSNHPAPDSFAFATVRKFVVKLEEFIPQGKGLYLHSKQAGTGKTTAAATIANEYMRSVVWKSNLDPYVVFVVVPELLERMRDRFDSPDPDLDDMLLDVEQVPLVVWDDIGTEKPSEWVRDRLYTLINRRYLDMKSNIFTSNLSLGELGARLSDRIASRIKGTCFDIDLDGADNRDVFK